MTELYSSFLTTKNNETIPVFYNGKTMESKYNATNDVQRIVSLTPKSNFYIILGIGSGLLIQKLLEIFPDTFFLCLERFQKDLDFLQQLPVVSNLKSKRNVIFSLIANLDEDLPKYYIPAFYGNLHIIEQRAWILENQDINNQIQNSIKKNLKFISQDFSVQAHFGKIWNKNIINNISIANEINNTKQFTIDNKKTAAIIAAGPSLDKSITIIKENPEKYEIIATDTAYSSLLEHKIIPSFVVSIDGQNISHIHFTHKKEYIKKSIFIFDLCADCSTVNHIFKNDGIIFFAVTGHPLSEYFYNLNPKNFIKLNSGSGTVTIAALNFAIQGGFEKIEIFGADFSYRNGKSYTKGTYLDKLYSYKANRILNSELFFDKLLFRTELLKIADNKFSTEVLDSYRNSLIQFLQTKEITFDYYNDIYYLNNPHKNKIHLECNYKNLYSNFLNSIPKNDVFIEKKSIFDLNPLEIALLPLISFLRFYDNKSTDFNYFFKAAYSYLPRD